MAGAQYTITLDDIGLAARFDSVAAGAEDMTDLMNNIGSVLINGARSRIAETNVDPDGVPWPKSFRVISGQGGKTLHDTGALLASITEEPGPREVTVGSALIYAAVHQVGATIRPRTKNAPHFTLADGTEVVAGEITIPARPYLGISEEERETILDVTTSYFEELLAGEAH